MTTPLNGFRITNLTANGLVEAFKGKTRFLQTVDTKVAKEYSRGDLNVGQTVELSLKPRPASWITGRTITPEATIYDKVSCTILNRNASRVISDGELMLSAREFMEDIAAPDINGGVREAERNALTAVLTQGAMCDFDSFGTDPANSRVWSDAAAKGRTLLMDDEIMGCMDPLTMSALANNESKLFRPGSIVDAAGLDGEVEKMAGVGMMYENINLPRLINGDGNVTGATVDGSSQPDGNSLDITGCTGATYLKGQKFYFSTNGKGDALDPQTKQVLRIKQAFTLTQDCPINTGSATLVFAPAFITTGSLKNIPSAPVGGNTITFGGAASKAYPMSLLYTRGSMDFVGLRFITEQGQGGVESIKNYKNLPLRTVYFTDHKDGLRYVRYDMMTGLVVKIYQHVITMFGKAQTI